MVKTVLPMQGAQVRELRSWMPHSVTKKRRKKKSPKRDSKKSLEHSHKLRSLYELFYLFSQMFSNLHYAMNNDGHSDQKRLALVLPQAKMVCSTTYQNLLFHLPCHLILERTYSVLVFRSGICSFSDSAKATWLFRAKTGSNGRRSDSWLVPFPALCMTSNSWNVRVNANNADE